MFVAAVVVADVVVVVDIADLVVCVVDDVLVDVFVLDSVDLFVLVEFFFVLEVGDCRNMVVLVDVGVFG